MKDRKTSKEKSNESYIENQEKAGTCNAMHVRAVKQKEHRADALALGAEEGRDKLR